MNPPTYRPVDSQFDDDNCEMPMIPGLTREQLRMSIMTSMVIAQQQIDEWQHRLTFYRARLAEVPEP